MNELHAILQWARLGEAGMKCYLPWKIWASHQATRLFAATPRRASMVVGGDDMSFMWFHREASSE
jgi:hypothetical protein